MKLLAIDPGFAHVGWALFDLRPYIERGGRSLALEDRARCLVTAGEFHTPAGSTPARLNAVDVAVTNILVNTSASAVVYETPGYAGVHAGRSSRQRGKQPVNADAVAKMYMGHGVIVVAIYRATGFEPIAERALAPPAAVRPGGDPDPEGTKRWRQDQLRRALDKAGNGRVFGTHLTGPKGGVLEHACDAAWIGTSADWPAIVRPFVERPAAGARVGG